MLLLFELICSETVLVISFVIALHSLGLWGRFCVNRELTQ